ncbi:MAG TPA: efflux RND transporter periplasmic adaptor subunit, partial [Woeseiaceae bacterium]
ETMPIEPGTFRFSITSQGIVRPLTETIMSAEVSGAIVDMSPKFVAGGVFAADEVLMQIDAANYTVEVEQAEAFVKQRQIEFDGATTLEERGYRAGAEVASAAAALASAKAELVRAKRNLDRTVIRLPYAGMVRAKEVDLGQYVTVGSRLGVAFATDIAEVRLPLTDSDLGFVDLPAPGVATSPADNVGTKVSLIADYRGRQATWPAFIARTEGVVDERSRVTYVVARIDDPYGLKSTDNSVPPLPMGTFVTAQIEGRTVTDAVRVPRHALRGNSELMFVDADDRLRIRAVDVLRMEGGYAYIAEGVEVGDRISLTAIESPVNGMRVRVEGTSEDTSDEQRIVAEDSRQQ